MRWTIHGTSTASAADSADDATVAQDGQPVGDREQLLEPVRDVDDRRRRARVRSRMTWKSTRNLGALKRRGRLVHEQDARVVRRALARSRRSAAVRATACRRGARGDRRSDRAARASVRGVLPARPIATVPQRVQPLAADERGSRRRSGPGRAAVPDGSCRCPAPRRRGPRRTDAVAVEQQACPRSAARCRRGS